jgi:hypothetical protein
MNTAKNIIDNYRIQIEYLNWLAIQSYNVHLTEEHIVRQKAIVTEEDFYFANRDGLMYNERSINGGEKIFLLFDGERYREKSDGQWGEVTHLFLKRVLELKNNGINSIFNRLFLPFSILESSTETITYVGTKLLDNKEYHCLVEKNDNTNVECFFDIYSGFLYCTYRYNQSQLLGGFLTTTYYKDYKRFGEILLPSTVVRTLGDVMSTTTSIQSFIPNTPMPEVFTEFQ